MPIALADVAFVNGADLFLGRQLIQTGLAPRLLAYAGWNTAGNTLGTVLAHAVLHLLMLRQGPFRNELPPTWHSCSGAISTIISTRLSSGLSSCTMICPPSDWLPVWNAFQRINWGRSSAFKGSPFGRGRGVARSFVQAGLVEDIRISNISLPWQRLFEIAFDVQVELP